MKKIVLLLAGILVMSTFTKVNAQIISESARRKVTVGVDVFSDMWLNIPANMTLRTVHQGANAFIQYNFNIGKSKNITFAAGVGIDNHNLFTNTRIDNVKADTIVFVPISGDTKYKRSKMNLVSVSAPLELKFRWKSGLKLGVGMKIGYVFDSKEKYVGNSPQGSVTVNEKTKGIAQLETLTFGPTLRFGYKFINIYGHYQINSVFRMGHGPQINPFSVGITITPF